MDLKCQKGLSPTVPIRFGDITKLFKARYHIARLFLLLAIALAKESFSLVNLAKLGYYILTMVIRMRHTRAHTGNRRSHHALKNPTLTTDSKTGVKHLRHYASSVTGTYKGLPVKSLQKKIERNLKRAQEKAKAQK